MRHARGFTMVELVLVLIVTGVLAVVALPRLFGPNDMAARGARDAVQATLRYAQQSAVAMRRNVCISASTTLLTVTYASAAGSAQACAAGNALASPGNGKPFGDGSNALPGGSTLAVGGTLVFDAQGRPYSAVGSALASTLSFTVNGYATPVTVEAETGAVQ